MTSTWRRQYALYRMLGGRFCLRPGRPTMSRGAAQAERPTRAALGTARHQGLHDLVRVRRQHDVGLATGVLPGPVGVDQHLDRTGGEHEVNQSATTFDAQRLTEAQDDLRHMRARRSSRPAAGHRRPRRSASPARRGCGHPSAGRRGRASPRWPRGGGRSRGGPRPLPRRSSPSRRDARGRRRRRASPGRALSGRVPRGATAGRCGGPGAAHRGRRASGSRNARLACTGPGPMGPAVASATRRLPSERQLERACLVGHTGVDRPAQRPREQPGLLDGLGRADVMELGRPVRSAHDERHAGQVRLHHSRVNPDRRRSARRDEHRRATGAQARSRPRRRPPSARPAARAARSGSHDARATTSGVERETGSHDGVGQSGAHPLVDERGREAGRYRHRRCPSSASPPTGRPGSTRRRGPRTEDRARPRVHPDERFLGAHRRASSKATSRSSCRTFPGTASLRCPIPARGSTRPPGLSARRRQGRLRRLLARRPVLPASGTRGAGPRRAPRHRRGASGHPRRGRSPAPPGRGRGARRPSSNGAATRSWRSSSTHGSPDRSSPT